MITIFDIIGIIGVFLAVGAYLFVLSGKMDGEGLWFPLLNAIACIAVTISLMFKFNLAAFFTELSFFSVSIYGLVRYYRSKSK